MNFASKIMDAIQITAPTRSVPNSPRLPMVNTAQIIATVNHPFALPTFVWMLLRIMAKVAPMIMNVNLRFVREVFV